MRLTINISDTEAKKAQPFLNYLKSLDFIHLENEEELEVPKWHKKIVMDRLASATSTSFKPWTEVRKSIRKK